MDISRFAVKRPIGIVILTLIVILIGSISLSRLPIDMMPDITRPTLSISTTYTNASPQEIEQLITKPIEQAMSSVQGVQEVTSVSMEGNSNVRVTFTWGVDLDAAANDMRDRLDRVIPLLPDEATRPMLRKFDMANTPILMMGAYGNLDPIQMYNIIDTQIRYRLEKIPGVATLNIWGGLIREIQVDLYADKIKALNLSIDQIINRITAENVNLPLGAIEHGNLEITIRNPGEYKDIEQLKNTVIIKKGTTPIKLQEIASVEDSFAEVRQIVRVNGKPGIRLSINKQSGENTVEVAAKVLEEIKKINQEIPQLKIVSIIDTSNYIRQSINNLSSSVIYGGMLAVFVLLFFLRNILSTVIIAIAIPISIIATFILIYFGKFTLNMMSLGGLALGAGMLVDNSIVVLENIHRLRDESGYKSVEAALKGTEEVRGAIIASTLTVLVVFLPLIFVRGMSGVMFQQLAYVVSFSLVCSLGVAMTLVPMLSSRIFKDLKDDGKKSSVSDKLNVFFTVSHKALIGLENFYKKYLNIALNKRKRVIIAVFLILASTLLLFPLVGVEFMPVTDENEARVSIEMEPGTRIELMDEKMKMIESVIKKEVPEMFSMISSIGGSGWRAVGTNTGEIRISLKSRSMRKRSSEDIARHLQRNLAGIPGVTIRCRAGEGFFLHQFGGSNAERIQLEIRGYDLSISEKIAPQLKGLVEEVDGVTDVKINQESGIREDLFIIDRDKAADLHLSVSKIANSLQTILSGTRAGYYREGSKEYKILVKFKDSKKMTEDEILNLSITNDEGQAIALSNVLKINTGKGYTQIERKNQERIFTLSANATGRPMGDVLDDINQKLKSIPVTKDFSIAFGGNYEEQERSTRDLLTSLALSLVMIYMVMALFYESLIDPFIVMFSVPLASIGVIIMLFLTNTTFNLQSYIGCIMLGGIVVNNAILLVDQANMLMERDGMSVMDSIKEAGRRRLRPILMTKLTAILGLLPLAMGFAEGGEAEAPMARAVIGGLLSATLITLVLIPVIYSIFKKNKLKPSQ